MNSTKGQYVLYLFKGRVHLQKNISLEEHQLIHRKGFISLAIIQCVSLEV
jgi:hypothetical protein